MAEVTCEGRSIREINADIKSRIRGGEKQITIRNPGARHNLGVAILESAHVTIEGSAGYYCGALADGSTVEVKGSAGWGLAESMLNGTAIVHGSAGNGAGAGIRGGALIVCGDAGDAFADSMYATVCYVGGKLAGLGTDTVIEELSASDIEFLDA